MNKKIWSVILLCILMALLIFLCSMGIEVREVMDAFKDSISSDKNTSGLTVFAGILGVFSVLAGSVISSFLLSCSGIVFSFLNIRIAPNKAIRYISVGFLILYSVSAFAIVCSFLVAFLFF